MTVGALDFPRWTSIGSDFLVTSNINQWITCQPGTGSLVDKVEGTITCQLIKVVATACTSVVPTFYSATLDPSAVGLFAKPNMVGTTYYFWEGYTSTGNWPTHDPCGANGVNQVPDVPDPRGQIYLRRSNG
jgi:hypothetical protein